jgi:predicted ATP-dependent endonuclease of OLD family
MIWEIHIVNFKSIQDLRLDLGRVNVLIGENGSGKSNVLEAIAFASAAAQDKLDNEFLASRGIRVTDPQFMRAAFAQGESVEGKNNDISNNAITISIADRDGTQFHCYLQSEETSTYPRWVNRALPLGLRPRVVRTGDGESADASQYPQHSDLEEAWRTLLESVRADPQKSSEILSDMGRTTARLVKGTSLKSLIDFLIYSPENSALRIFQAEGQILPLGIRGEGLFAHLKALRSEENKRRLLEITEKLVLIDWFDRFDIPEGLAPGERSIRIRDRYLPEGALFDQRSANEGFLLLLFYFTVFASPDTPGFFAIDNVDASLNPKLCSALIRELVDLAGKHDKQILLTTHNPAVLDGLDLNDDEQRLLVVYRSRGGDTRVRRVPPPKPVDGEPPMRLSEAFMRGYIGGLPKNF